MRSPSRRLLLLAALPIALPAAYLLVAAPIARAIAATDWKHEILSTDAQVRAKAVTEARAAGPGALNQLLQAHQSEIQAHLAGAPADAGWPRLREAIDAVSGQRDGWASGLYWHTDLDRAKAQAKREQKPILSLRMLGRLDEELSCANSRFFRTALYPDPRISSILRDKFVLVWGSERPVPIVTVDMGDGRVLKRTLTGNSAHYILDEDGRPLDAMPGMVAPGFFARWLQLSQVLEGQWREQKGRPNANQWLKKWHQTALEEAADRYAMARAQLTGTASPSGEVQRQQLQKLLYDERKRFMTQVEQQAWQDISSAGNAANRGRFPRANMAAPRAVSKVMAEGPILGGAFGMPTELGFGDPLAAAFRPDARLSASALGVMKLKSPAWAAQPNASTSTSTSNLDSTANVAPFRQDGQAQLQQVASMSNTKLRSPAPRPSAPSVPSMRERFELTMAQDTVLNEFNFHARIHGWMSRGKFDFPTLNSRVYSTLFLTPRADQWLGLNPTDAFSGVENDGVQTVSTSR